MVARGEAVVVIVPDKETVAEPQTVFVAYGVVGSAHAVGVRVILSVPVLDPGGLGLTVCVTDTESVPDCVELEEVLREGDTLCVTVGVPRRVPEIVPVGEGGLEPETVLDAHWSAVPVCRGDTVGEPVELRATVGVTPGVPENWGLGEVAAEGDPVPVTLGTLGEGCGDAVSDCVEVPETDTQLL